MKKIFASVFFAALFISFANAENNFFCNNFSKTFINALISEKVSDLDDLMPTEDFLRKNFPAEADKLKEGEELQKAIKEKIKQDFQLIIQSKKKFNIDPTKFENIAKETCRKCGNKKDIEVSFRGKDCKTCIKNI